MSEPCLGEAESGPVNCFALVSYIPGQLGRFLDEIRCELEPNSLAPRAHVTLLPPRSLAGEVTPREAESYLNRMMPEVSALEIYLGAIEVFPVTNVVYVSVDGGFLQMKKLHDRLNAGPLGFVEPFHYHPHVTLAQNLSAGQAERIRRDAASRWERYRGPRAFSTDAFSFVQANQAKRWVDLAEYTLAPAAR